MTTLDLRNVLGSINDPIGSVYKCLRNIDDGSGTDPGDHYDCAEDLKTIGREIYRYFVVEQKAMLKIDTIMAEMIWKYKLAEIYELHDDGAESLVLHQIDFDNARDNKAQFGIEGQLHGYPYGLESNT